MTLADHLPLMAGALRSPFRRPRPDADFPRARLVRSGVRVDLDRLAAYERVCGFPTGEDALPLTYPHVLAFPLAMRLMGGRGFPLPLLGLVHTSIDLTRHTALPVGGTYELAVHVAGLSPHRRGTEATLVTEARTEGELVWESRSTYLARHRTGGGSGAPDDEMTAARDGWAAPGVLGSAPDDRKSAPDARRTAPGDRGAALDGGTAGPEHGMAARGDRGTAPYDGVAPGDRRARYDRAVKPDDTGAHDRGGTTRDGRTAHGEGVPADHDRTTARDNRTTARDDRTPARGGSACANGPASRAPSPVTAPPSDGGEPLPGGAEWRLGADIGRRYAVVSGDRNPIHLHPLAARLFGFPRPIAHGMWTVARCLAAHGTPEAVLVRAEFRAPVPLPGTVEYAAEDGRFELRRGDRLHLAGTVRPSA